MKPQRIQLSRAAGFSLQAASLALNGLPAVSVARPGKWGNPFKVDMLYAHGPQQGQPLGQAGAVRAFENLMRTNLRLQPAKTRHQLHFLRGKNLACWCALPKPGEPDLCHAAVLLRLANEEA